MVVADITHKWTGGKKVPPTAECLLLSVEGMMATPTAQWPIEVRLIRGCSSWWEDTMKDRMLVPFCSILSQIFIRCKGSSGDQVAMANSASDGTGRPCVPLEETCWGANHRPCSVSVTTLARVWTGGSPGQTQAEERVPWRMRGLNPWEASTMWGQEED